MRRWRIFIFIGKWFSRKGGDHVEEYKKKENDNPGDKINNPGTSGCMLHPSLELTLANISDSLRIFSDWKILDEERQKNLIEQQKIISLKLEDFNKCINDIKILLAESYVTKEELNVIKALQDQKISKAHERIDKHIKKQGNTDTDNIFTKSLVFDIIKILVTAVLILAGYRLFSPDFNNVLFIFPYFYYILI